MKYYLWLSSGLGLKLRCSLVRRYYHMYRLKLKWNKCYAMLYIVLIVQCFIYFTTITWVLAEEQRDLFQKHRSNKHHLVVLPCFYLLIINQHSWQQGLTWHEHSIKSSAAGSHVSSYQSIFRFVQGSDSKIWFN